MGRAPCCDKANVKRGPWSPEEDAKLKSHMETHGTGGNWIALPQKIGLRRCGKSCRLRWLNYLRPNIKHGGFTEEEDNLICSLYVTIGSRWSIIAAQLPGRTDNDIKNYWNTRLKKKLLGKQRREHQARRDISFTNKQLETTKKGLICYENYPNNEFFGLYPQQPPSLAGYTSGQETQVLNSRDDILIMPSFATIGYDENYDHKQQKDENLERFDQNEEMYKNPSFSSLEGGFDEIQMHGIPPQVGSFSGLELVNSSTVSQEMSTIWEDVNSLLYPSAGLPVHEFCQTRMPQEWTYFEEPRLPGY